MFSNFVLTSAEPVTNVRDRLAASLTTARPNLWDATTFRGWVSDIGFCVARNLAWLERTLPIVATGRFVSSAEGTVVRVRTRPQVWVLLVVGVWSAVCAQLLWRRLVSDPLPGGVHWGEVAVILGFIAFGWGLVFVAWMFEEWWCREALSRLLSETGPVEARTVRRTSAITHCSHCGAALPMVRDAYCLDCGEALAG